MVRPHYTYLVKSFVVQTSVDTDIGLHCYVALSKFYVRNSASCALYYGQTTIKLSYHIVSQS